jgi:hypothetical protein
METEAFFQEKVYLTPKDLHNELKSIDVILIDKLKERLEQRCSPHGYVLPGTLELITRSTGMVDSGRFTGDWAFLIKAKGKVLHPPEGTVVEVEVLKSNKMGIYAVYENAIRIMVPRDLHLGDDEFDQIQVGEHIRVEIQKSRFQLKDQFIVSVGIYRGRTGSPTRVLTAPVQADEPEDSEVESEEAEPEGDVESGAEEEETQEAKEE